MEAIPLTPSTHYRVLNQHCSQFTDTAIGMPSLKSYLDPKVKERTLAPSARVDLNMPSTNMQI